VCLFILIDKDQNKLKEKVLQLIDEIYLMH